MNDRHLPDSRHSCAAFSLIELLVTLVVVMLLVTITVPVINHVRSSASSTRCLVNLRQIGIATMLYSKDNSNMTPALGAPFYAQLWPYLYSSEQVKNINVTGTGLPGAPITGSVFECPDAHLDAAPYVTIKRSYGANQSLVPGATSKDTLGVDITAITDPSSAALFGDVRNSSALRPTTVNGRHGGHMNVVYVDGHTASVELTEAITSGTGWNTNPFWVGTRR